MAKAKLLKVIFLGGVGEIGKNMTALEYSDSILIVDSGMSFPTEETPGVDAVIPDINYLRQNIEKVKGIVLTHGHEDHIGALPYLIGELGVPVYGTKFTLGLVELKLLNQGIKSYDLRQVQENSAIDIDCWHVEFIKVCHSIAGASSLCITTPVGKVFVTGDYKIDFTPIDNKLTNLERIAEIGKEGVLLMLGESTNVEREGHSTSEKVVGKSLEKVFIQNPTRRLVIATFATNNYRVQQILNLAEKFKRKVLLSGRSMKNIADMAKNIGELHFAEDLIIDTERAKKLPPERVVVISTGTQGEPMSALSRMSQGEFNSVNIGVDDTVVLSSSPIPGNERPIYGVINSLYHRGAEVLYEAMYDIHSSGHAFREELKLMLQLVKPKYFIPVHGEYRHLVKHAQVAESLGINKSNIIIPDLGMVVVINQREFKLLSSITAGRSFIDGAELGDKGDEIIRDRRSLSKDGLIIVFATVMFKSGEIINGPEIIPRGFAVDDTLVASMKDVVTGAIASVDFSVVQDYNDVKTAVRKALRKYISNNCKQYPMILPVIIEG